MNDRQRAQAFLERLDGLMKRDGKGKMYATYEQFAEVVRDDPGMTAIGVQAYLKYGETEPAALQLAEVLAAAYEKELKDDSLSRMVERTLRERGLESSGVRYEAADERPAGGGAADPRPIALNYDRATLEKGDIHVLVQTLSVERAAERGGLEDLKALKGRMVFTFELEDDPRPVWKIELSRALIRKVADRIPHFPYFLLRHPKLDKPEVRELVNPYLVYFGCLADLDAMEGNNVNLAHDSVIQEVIRALDAIDEHAAALGEKPKKIRREVLSGFTPEFVSWFRKTHRRYR